LDKGKKAGSPEPKLPKWKVNQNLKILFRRMVKLERIFSNSFCPILHGPGKTLFGTFAPERTIYPACFSFFG
jgi:hypothetical protein